MGRAQIRAGDSRIRMSLLDVIGLVVVGTLVAFLCRRHEERICHRMPERSHRTGSIDASRICQRIRRVRGDYLAVICARSRNGERRKQLHEQVCRTLRCRAYFRRNATDLRDPTASETAKHLA
jgi:hypothetical protein